MERAPERVEAMIGERDQQRVFIGAFKHAADGLITTAIERIDLLAEIRRKIAIESGMLGIAEAPEHVLQAVGRIEQNEEEAFAEAAKFVIHHLLALVVDEIALREIIHFVEAAVVVAVVIFG